MTKSVAASLFPNNPNNQFYEQNAPANRSWYKSAESWICAIGSAFPLTMLGAHAMKEAGIEQLATDRITQLSTPGLLASAAFVVIGLCVTRFQLQKLAIMPLLFRSNVLTAEQIDEYLTRMKAVAAIKLIDPKSAKILQTWIQTFERLNPNKDLPHVYFNPETREFIRTNLVGFEKFEQDLMPNTKTKGEILDLLNVVKRCRNDWAGSLGANFDTLHQERCDRLDQEEKAQGQNKVQELISQVRRLNSVPGITFVNTPWEDAVINLKDALKHLLKQVEAEPSSARIYINKETRDLISVFEKLLETEMPRFELKERIRIAVARLLQEVPISEISEKLGFSTDLLAQWKTFAQSEMKKLDGKKVTLEDVAGLVSDIRYRIIYQLEKKV